MKSISVCVPVHNRTYDLKRTLPHLIAAANAAPPVEIVILDYNSPDDLADYVFGVAHSPRLISENKLTYRKYTGRDYYHMAHARNLSVMAASGEYIVISSADIYPVIGFFGAIRQMIATGYDWMYDKRYKGVITMPRSEFIRAGGYDERFEFYGPEDQDLHLRMVRRGGKCGTYPPGMIKVITTPNAEKVKNYRLLIGKRDMSRRGRVVLDENIAYNKLVANEGRKWGQWI